MTKEENITDDNSCWRKARLYEQLFILREKDETMAETIEFWIEKRIEKGLNKEEDEKIQSARKIVEIINGRN